MNDDLKLDLENLLGSISETINTNDSDIDEPNSEGDNVSSIFTTIKKISQVIKDLPQEHYIILQPLLTSLFSLFKDIGKLVEENENPQILTNFSASGLLTTTQDGTGIYFNLGPDVIESFQNRFIDLLKKINQIDTDFSQGKIDENEFSLMRHIIVAKIIELIRISIS